MTECPVSGYSSKPTQKPRYNSVEALVQSPAQQQKLFKSPGTESNLEMKFVLADCLGGQGFLLLLRAMDSDFELHVRNLRFDFS